MNKILHFISIFSFIVFIVLGLACATTTTAPQQLLQEFQDQVNQQITPQRQDEMRRAIGPNEQVIGTVQTTFELAEPTVVMMKNKNDIPKAVNNHISYSTGLANSAYNALLNEARRVFNNNVDVRDVAIIRMNPIRSRQVHEVHVTGLVISSVGVSRGTITNVTGVEGALERAADEVTANISARSTIAIVYITAPEIGITEYIAGELEHILLRNGYIIIDRSELDRIRSEQRFGLSGEVDDNTAARIGNIAGAGIVITGRVDGEGALRRLRLRALDTSSARVVGTASERI